MEPDFTLYALIFTIKDTSEFSFLLGTEQTDPDILEALQFQLKRNLDQILTQYALYVSYIWVIPYQFTKVSYVTLSELDETWWVGSPSELM